MAKSLFLGIVILSLFLIGCSNMDLSSVKSEDINKVIQCESPYIRFGTGCCIDENKNGICDPDEKKEPICKDVQIPYDALETYETTEPYTVQVPYQENVCNNVQVPYEATETKSSVLFDFQDKTLRPNERLYRSVGLKDNVRVDVSFNADDTLNLFAVDDDEFNKIVSNEFYVSSQTLIEKTHVSSADASFKTIGADTYVIFLKNYHPIATISVFDLKATATWDEKVTKTKTETRCNLVTKYRNEQRTKQVIKTRAVTKYRTEERCE